MSKIFIAGNRGMVGSAIFKQLNNSDNDIITASRNDLDLTNQCAVRDFFEHHKFDQVYLAAAKVGGILANNSYPAEFIYQNLMIQSNVINSSYKSGVSKLLFLGSSCIYPKLTKQPMPENALLDGFLEPTNEPYAISKIAGLKMCESYNRQYALDYRSVMPTNLYGPGDNYHPENSHVIPGLIRRFHEAKKNNNAEVIVWGSGEVFREFLHVYDMAKACIHVMNLDNASYQKCTKPMLSHINVGSGEEITIKELAKKIAKVVKFSGDIIFDSSKPDGTPRKLLDSSLLFSLDWRPKFNLDSGLINAYEHFKNDDNSL